MTWMQKITVVTVARNVRQALRQTMDSVLQQDYENVEYIVVDGASTDGTVSMLESVDCPYLKWISEPDSGIYNAMNKGIEIALGRRIVNSFNRSELVEDKNKELPEYLLFLNGGDALENAEVVENFYKADIKTDIATGIEKEINGHLIYPKKEEELSYSFFYDDTLMHQSTFIRRDAFERFGMYNEGNRIVSDWEWFFNAIMKRDASYEPLDFVVALFDGEGISNSKRVLQSHNEEREGVRQRIMPRVRRDYSELKRLERVEKEYEYLKNGKMGWIVRMLLKLKAIKK